MVVHGVAALTSAALGFGSPARAEEPGSPEKSIEQRFEELDQEITYLETEKRIGTRSSRSREKSQRPS